MIANGNSVPFTGSGTLTMSADANGTFNGANALQQTGAILGESQSTEFDVASAPIMIPSAIGTSPMILGTLSRYTDSTQSVVLGTTQISVVVENIPVDPGSPELVQFAFKSYDASRRLVETDTQTYSLSEDGVLSFVSGTANNASGTLTVSSP